MHPHDSATTRLKVAGLWGFSGGRPGWSLACGHNVDNEEMTWRLCTYSMLLSQIQKRWNILENQLLCDALCNIYYALLCSAWNLGGKVNTKEEKWSRWIISNLKWGDLGMIPLLPTLRGDIMMRLFWFSQNDGWKLKRQRMDQMELNQTKPASKYHKRNVKMSLFYLFWNSFGCRTQPMPSYEIDIARFESLPPTIPKPPLWCLHWVVFTSQSLDMSDIIRLHRLTTSATNYVFRCVPPVRVHTFTQQCLYILTNWLVVRLLLYRNKEYIEIIHVFLFVVHGVSHSSFLQHPGPSRSHPQYTAPPVHKNKGGACCEQQKSAFFLLLNKVNPDINSLHF